MNNVVLVFDTTHHALWAEQVALATGCAAEIQPAPGRARARCSLALAYLPAEEAVILAALDRAGVPYRRYDPAAETTDADGMGAV
jgi:hypothetical protein